MNARLFSLLKLAFDGNQKQRFARCFEPYNETDRFLDIGCGTGDLSQLVHAKYVGVDLDEKFVRYAREKYRDKAFAVADACDLVFPGKSFDFVVLNDVLHHLSDTEAGLVLKEMARLTKERAYVCCVFAGKGWSGRFLLALDRGKFVRSIEQASSLISRYFKIEESKELENTGFYRFQFFRLARKGGVVG